MVTCLLKKAGSSAVDSFRGFAKLTLNFFDLGLTYFKLLVQFVNVSASNFAHSLKNSHLWNSKI